MAMKLNIQMFGAYADANLVLNQSDFERATEGVRNAHTKMDDLFTQQMALFTRDVHAEVWADGNCKTWFAGEFTTKTKAQLDSIAEQFNNILRGLDGLWSNVCSDLSVSKTGSAGSVSSSGNVDVSATQTDTFDDGTSGRRTYVGKHAETDMGQLNATLAPARHALREAVSIAPAILNHLIVIFSSESLGLVILRIKSLLLVEAEIVGYAFATNFLDVEFNEPTYVDELLDSSTFVIAKVELAFCAFKFALSAIVCLPIDRDSFNPSNIIHVHDV